MITKLIPLLLLLPALAQADDARIFSCFNMPRNGMGTAYRFLALNNEALMETHKVMAFHGEFILSDEKISEEIVQMRAGPREHVIVTSATTALLIEQPLTAENQSLSEGVVLQSSQPIVDDGEMRCRLGEIGESIL